MATGDDTGGTSIGGAGGIAGIVPGRRRGPSGKRVDRRLDELAVLERRRGADLVAGDLDELRDREVRAARVGDAGRGCRRRRRHGATGGPAPASGPSYQVSAARRTSTSGGGSSSRSRRTNATCTPLARALSPTAASAKGSMSGCGDVRGAGARGRDRHEPAPGREVEDARSADRLRVLLQVAREREPARPRERPERDRLALGADGLLGRVPDRLDRLGEVEADPVEPLDVAQPACAAGRTTGDGTGEVASPAGGVVRVRTGARGRSRAARGGPGAARSRRRGTRRGCTSG